MTQLENEGFFRVNPRGTFFAVSPEDRLARPASRLRLRQFGFRPGDFVGLHRTGDVHYGTDRGDTIKSLWMESRQFSARALTEVPFVFRWRGEDILLCPRDTWYSDNSDPDGDYGVVVSYVNSRPPTSGSSNSTMKRRVSCVDSADCTTTLCSPDRPVVSSFDILTEDDHRFETKLAEISNSIEVPLQEYPHQYRGWYENETWSPESSKWHGPRLGGRHKGIDVFLMSGTNVVSPTDGTLLINPFSQGPRNPTFGRSSVVKYGRNGKIYFVIFAHLSENGGRTGRHVRRGEIIGRSGCSGNAGTDLPCGQASSRNSYGGRSDHLHVEIREGSIKIAATKIDPLSHFRWQIE